MRIGKKKEPAAAAITNDVPTKPLCSACGANPISVLAGSLCVSCYAHSLQGYPGTYTTTLNMNAAHNANDPIVQQAMARKFDYAPVPEPTPTFEVVDSTELVRGYKAFSLEWMTLKGGYNQFWYERSMTAECKSAYYLPPYVHRESSEVAMEHLSRNLHECGIWSTKTLAELRSRWMGSTTLLDERRVVAEVILSGVVIGAERGYRSEHAEIQQLWLPKPPNDEMMAGYSATANALASRYGVPVTIGYPEEAVEIVSDESAFITPAQLQRWNSYYGHSGMQASVTPVAGVTTRRPSSAWKIYHNQMALATVYTYAGKYRTRSFAITDTEMMSAPLIRDMITAKMLVEEGVADNP